MDSGLSPGVLIEGKYKILRLIGSGGMGSVYEGENTRIRRRVAIKVLHASIASEKSLVERFEREAQAAARIGSHHVADVLDLGDLATGERFMVMEYLEGETLAERLKAKQLIPPIDFVPLATQLLEGLGVMHQAGIVHRDLKPGNIFLARANEGDFVKILDFGVCKFRASHDLQWTTSGANILGTPGYMSPEQITSDTVDGRADLYSVGILLYRCACGRFPYEADSASELLIQIRDGKPTPILQHAPDLDKEFAALVMKSIERDPAKRFQTAKEFQEALFTWAESAARVENLLAEFLDRPGTVAPPKSGGAKPPRFTAKRLSFRQHVAPETSEPTENTQPLPPPERTEPVSGPAPRPPERTPRLPSATTPSPSANVATGPPPSSASSSSASSPSLPVSVPIPPSQAAARSSSAQMRAIVLGAALGAIGAVILYAALFR
jgi:serine/threonine-protein kinase